MQEAVRVQIVLVTAIVLADMALIGPQHTVTDLAAVAVLVASGAPLLNRRMVQRRPYATALFAGALLELLIAADLIEEPNHSTIYIGSFAVVVVGSALFCTFDQRPHLVWLAFTSGLMLSALQIASIGSSLRFQGEVVTLAAVIASAAGNRLVQARRERMYATEAKLREERRDLREVVARLEAARRTIADLEGVLPICAHCKRIRDGEVWVRVETYVSERSRAQFSHGICPDCAERYFPGVLADS